ncbi:FAD-dependent oxidoreductase [Streptomyces albireticuli]|uniref:FAD-dependent oxidoreductase n=1 Tax=Streptomyces albireticuli TaxID=1940 RepID=A0A2A2CVB1_9ACTN|nr:FAD-dependent oxidoreductase [Streptomyces albireticuli]MCD9141415.1 FAD-dependent oxidoreductase [Streptomyces albireticuli]MCD9160624.1 FAD-dependent oxidoreductase [Streptomyces albireticuli]MCD9195820.1 FAD-dependent oxidoreductase [Streptomyces albireticuli]PAU44143.1 FAD-dependent oxidoreductase [Streptomyces albireticuli]
MPTPPATTHESYWMDSTPATAYAALGPVETEAEVAVVGGGIAGLCTAWELARAGADVVVLEADRIAAGVTGYTTAKVSALQGLVYSGIRSAHGPEAAALYARAQLDAVEHTAALCARAGADAELERADAFTYAETPEGAEAVREEARAAGEAGLDVGTVGDPADLPFPVAAAVRLPGQLQFHPRKFLLALAEGFTAGGGRIHERTRVTALREGAHCHLTTEGGGTVRARDVVVATHYPVFDRSLLFARLTPRRELVVAAAVPAGPAPRGMYLTPEGGTRSVRTAPYGDGRRLVIVTGEKFTPGAADVEARFARLRRWAEERVPGFGDSTVHYRWAAQDNDSDDHVPYIGPAHPGTRHVHVATGFGGWGMTNGVLAGRLLAARITGGPRPDWTQLFDPRRLPPLRRTGALLKDQMEVAKHFVGDRLHTTHVDSVTDIAPGRGAVVRVDGRRCAVYREPSGEARAVSARCTHLGCLVHFNDAERTWDCPCHGSRFATDGSVLHGPAVHPLEPRDLPGPDRTDEA